MNLLFAAAPLFLIGHSIGGEIAGGENFLDAVPPSVRSMGLGWVGAVPAFRPEAKIPVAVHHFSSLHAELPFGDQLFFLGGGSDYPAGLRWRVGWMQLQSTGVQRTVFDSIGAADTVAFRALSSGRETENLINAAPAFQFSNGWRFEINLKYLESRLGAYRGVGWGMDAGAAGFFPGHRVGAGFVLKNAIPAVLHFGGLGRESLTRTLLSGWSWRIVESRLTAFFEAKQLFRSGELPAISLGAEFHPLSTVAFRAGCGELFSGGHPLWTLGMGFLLKGISFDYAYNGRRDSAGQGVHRLGIGYAFSREDLSVGR